MPGLKQRAGGGNRSQIGYHAKSQESEKPKNTSERDRSNTTRPPVVYNAKSQESAKPKHAPERDRSSNTRPAASAKRKRSEDDADEGDKAPVAAPAKEDKYTVLATAALATMDAHHPKRWKLETKVASHHDRKAQWLSLSEEEKEARAKEAKASKRALKKLSAAKGKDGSDKGASKVERAVAEAQKGVEMDAMLGKRFKEAGLPSYLDSNEWLSSKQAGSIAGAVTEKVGRIYRRQYACQRLGLDPKTGLPPA